MNPISSWRLFVGGRCWRAVVALAKSAYIVVTGRQAVALDAPM
jgi:hypothetical protein